MTDHRILIADIGGTNARFAFATEGPHFFTHAQTFEAGDFAHVSDAVDVYLHSHDVDSLDAICLAVAGPIRNEKVSFTNSNWSIDCADLRQHYGTEQTQLLNDWEAIAYSLSCLPHSDLIDIGGSWNKLGEGDFSVGALGPGSGLGVAGLLRRNEHLTPIVTEAGHVGFSPENQLQDQILYYLRQKFDDRVSRERLLSGPGLINIHEALCHINNQENPGLIAADIAVGAFINHEPLCMQAFDLFFEILGQVAGDLALALGAQDGVYLGGGISQRYPTQLAQSRFRQGFENKGRYRSLMEDIPTWLITHQNPGLLGASVYARHHFLAD